MTLQLNPKVSMGCRATAYNAYMSDENTQPLMIADRIEALLFTEGGSLQYKKLLLLLNCSDEELHTGIATLAERRSGTGFTVTPLCRIWMERASKSLQWS